MNCVCVDFKSPIGAALPLLNVVMPAFAAVDSLEEAVLAVLVGHARWLDVVGPAAYYWKDSSKNLSDRFNR